MRLVQDDGMFQGEPQRDCFASPENGALEPQSSRAAASGSFRTRSR